ncbi:MAG TPA: dockerin type I domain-containing protein [Candidatus Saccharimonadales bacterium]|jgi:mannan endo-1,4-beta-mannosidase
MQRGLAVLIAVLIAGLGVITLIPSRAATGTQGIITRQGTKLMLDGGQYKFAGLNADTWFGCWAGEIPSDAQLERYFSEINPKSMTRLFFVPGSNTAIMDRIVAAAERHHQYLAVALAAGNGDCGQPRPNMANPQYELNWISTVVPKYKDSPAIGFWEVSNEASGGDPNIQNYYTVAANRIKQLDPNTLVGSGGVPQYAYGSYERFKAAHSAPTMDLISIHEYDAATGRSHWAASAEQAAQELQKVWYAGEDGFCCNGGDTGTESGNASKLDAEWRAYLESPAGAGMLYWDFKLGYANTHTVNFGDAMWQKASSFRHAYNSGTTTPPPAPTPTPSPPAGSGSINDSTFTYTGTWATANNAGSYNGDDRYSRSAGSTYALTFTGTQAKIYASKAPQHGILAVGVDGGAESLVDLYAATRADQQLVYTSPTLTSGSHTITARVTGTKNAAATDTVVNADRIDIVAGAATTPPTPGPTPPPPAPGTPGDVNGDGRVNALDLSTLISRDGQSYAPADFNGDGTVGAADMAILLSRWTW